MICAILFLSFLAQAGSAQSELSPEAVQHLQAGIAAEKAQQLETAIAEFRKATELEPNAAIGYVRLGEAYMSNHAYAEAVTPLRRALELDPELPAAHLLLGYAQLAQGYAADAIPHLDKIHELGGLGIAQIQTGQISEAVSNLQAAVKQRPNDPDLLYYLSQASELLAQQSADALLANFPDSDRAHQRRGQNYFALHQAAQAEQEYQRALTLRPDLPGLHMELGQVYAESAQWSKAEEQYRMEAKLQPGNAQVAYRLGDALLQEGHVKESLRELQLSNDLQPDMPETLYSLGKAASATGDAEIAEKSWTRVIALEKESPLAAQAHFGLAGLYRKQGKATEAAAEMWEFRKLQERNGHAKTD